MTPASELLRGDSNPPAALSAEDLEASLSDTGEMRSDAVLDSLHQHIALLDRAGRVVWVNLAWRRFGLENGAARPQAESVGLNYLAQCGPSARTGQDEHAAAAHAGISAVLDGSLPRFELEYPCHAPAGDRWFLMRVSPLVGTRPGAIVAHEDITTRWRLEQHRATLIAELLNANRELNDFAYVVSHDLKAPLRGISSLASWLVADLSDKLGPEGTEQLNLIASRVKRLSGLIDGILAYSRSGRSLDERCPVDLAALVPNTIDLLAPPPHIDVRIETPLPTLLIEPVKIQQVFQNLLSNAIDFIEKPSGRVTVRCARAGAAWRFSVSDNGPGIEARHFQRIFQLFQTLSSRDQRERTGVGLALVKKIVELEGGSITVESKVGAGTTFHFSLPAVPSTPSPRADPSPEAATT